MDIAQLSMNMSASNTMSQIGTAVLGKQLDTIEDLGSSMIASMNAMPSSASLESMVSPAVGGNIDMTV